MGWGIALSRSPFRRFRLRLTVLYAGVFGLVLVAFAAIAYALMGQALLANVDRANADAVAGITRGLVLTAQGPRLKEDFETEIAEAIHLHGVALARVFDAQGHPADGGGPLMGPLAVEGPPRETMSWQRTPVRLLREPLRRDGQVVGVLLIAHSLAEAELASASFLKSLTLVIPLALAVTLGLGVWLASFAVRPVRQAFELQRQFLADASHELRTPVSVLQAQSGIVLDTPLPDQKVLAETMLAIHRTSERMGRLVSDLLFLSRADAAGMPLQVRRFYMDELTEDVVDDFRELAQAKGVALELDASSAEAPIEADPDRIQQLLGVLVDNAIKFTPTGGCIKVRVGRNEVSGTVLVQVRDTGPGIAPEEQSRIFERFYQIDPSRSGDTSGAGLGLAIAQTIAQAHGGKVNVTSTPGAGAAFEVVLPSLHRL